MPTCPTRLRGPLQLASLPATLPASPPCLQFLGQGPAGLEEPLFLVDHVAAIGGWLGFYVIEAMAIAAVLKSYAGDQSAAVRQGAWPSSGQGPGCAGTMLVWAGLG